SVEDIVLYEFNPDRSLKAFSEADTGRFDGSELILNSVTRLEIDDDALGALADATPPERALISKHQTDTRRLSTTLTAERLMARVLTPEHMSISTLLDYISHLQDNQIEADRQLVALWRKFAYPFTLLVMITIAAPIRF